MSAASTATTGTRVLQGIEVPAESVNPGLFMARTRRKVTPEFNRPFAGLGGSDPFELRKSDILSGIFIKFSGALTVNIGTGTVASTMRWPYDVLKTVKFIANGQSNLVNVSGLKLKVREQQANQDITDRGVTRTVGSTSVNQGTLSMGSENWGVAAGAPTLASGTYPVELIWYVPIAEDHKDLSGAIFAQTNSMDLTLLLEYESAANLFPVTGNGTASLTGNVSISTEKYSIPVQDGNFILPDLSVFHSMVQTRQTGLSIGDNPVKLVGQGAGKNLLRCTYQVWNGATPQVPLVASAANFGNQVWQYSANETPETWIDGQLLREWNERIYNTDVGAIWGFMAHEFGTINGFRDIVDMGQTSELRIGVTIAGTAPALSNCAVEYVQETIFAAGQG